MTDEEIKSEIDESEKRSDGGLSDLRDECRRLEAESSGLREQLRTALLRMEALEQKLEETASVAATAAEDAANAAASTDGGEAEAANPVMDGPSEQPPPTVDREPFAYEVMESEGKVYCFLPKKKEESSGEGEGEGEDDDEGASEFCGGAYGGPHIGSSSDPIAEADAAPHAKSGYQSNSGSGDASISDEPEQLDFSWAHYGWYEVGEMNTSGSGVEDKVVVATFDVPIDPPEDQRSGASVEGPSLSEVELVDVDDWRETCKDSWSQFDDPSGESVTRKIPIALLANGVVTQLCLGVPFVDRGGNGDGGDPTKVDTRDMPESGCQKSVDFYHTFEPDEEIEEPDGQGGTRKKWKAKDQSSSVGGATVYTYNRSEAAEHEEIAPGRIVQLYDFTNPSISVTEMPVPTPEVDSSGSVDGPVFLIRDEGGTGGVCPTLKYTQLKLKDDRCPPPDVWLESGTGDSVTLKVRSWTKNSSGDCESGITQYTFTPTSIDAPDCSAIKACISGETQTVVTDVFVSGDGNLYKTVRTAKALEWGTPSNVMIVSGTTCEEGGTS